ncbi:hypothetical protein [Flavobacterium fluviale]|uniref:DUF4836 family protein n=1 Tax=Flavobacterium fluviale TaxID=2249356 RepID=A0A344LPL6_9FLAO|nr:hypothetical protein [Flavobacterium fluviale]AXB55858.1 hypothetical protein HYN86_04270 [Flavobacterium fluviale]
MKHFYTFIFLLAAYLTFGQTNKYDYFVQFNGNQLSKKVSVAEVLNHPLINKYSSKKPDFDFTKYTSVIQLDQKITIHGKFSDSIPYYQVTIPIKNRDAVTQFLVKEFKISDSNDSIAGIEDFGKYSVLTVKGKRQSMVWNNNYLVILELTKTRSKNFYDVPPPVLNDSVYSEESYGDPVEVVKAPIAIEAPAASDAAEEEYLYDGNPYEEYTLQQAELDRELAVKQNAIVKELFENGFTAPISSKINESADISSWLDYGRVFSSLYSAYNYPMAIFGGYDKFFPMQQNFGNFVKGINVDFYFDKDNARVEEVIEYSEEIADVMGKITNRKINKNIFNYFPAQKPLAYGSYHMNTKQALESFPSLTADIFQNPKFGKEDITIVTDLISTIVDEEATAKLFDGDLSAFLYGMKDVEVMTKKYGYDENYEETITEEKVKKSIPLFSVIFTSTHPTFGDKLLQLGVRKKLLTQNGNYYQIFGTEEYGTIFILKDKDVVVIANTMDYFNNGTGTFVKEIKKDLGKNYMSGKLNIAQTVSTFGKNAKESDLILFNKIAGQFSDITTESPKKLVDNKLKFIFKLNSHKADKNIILQTLDLADEMTSK